PRTFRPRSCSQQTWPMISTFRSSKGRPDAFQDRREPASGGGPVAATGRARRKDGLRAGARSHTDPEVISACQLEGRALLSLDLDFSNILLFPPEHSPD